MRILLVEDDGLLGEGVRSGLAQARFAVAWAHDGEEAQLALSAENFDALVLDLGLPGIDGLTLLRWLRTRGLTLPVLILTAQDAVEDRVAGLNAGADADSDEAMAAADPDLLALLVRNLIDNAIRYTQPGGQVDVSVRTRGDRAILRVARSLASVALSPA